MSDLRPLSSAAAHELSASSVERLQTRIGDLCSERQRLRASGGGEGELEQNRIEIARLQQELSHALIGRHLRTAAA